MSDIVVPASAVADIQKEAARREEECRKAEAKEKPDRDAQDKGESEIKKFKEAVEAEALDWLISTKPDAYIQTMMLMGAKGAEAVNAAHAADVASRKAVPESEESRRTPLTKMLGAAVKAVVKGEHELEGEAKKVGARLTAAATKLDEKLVQPKREITIPDWLAARFGRRGKK